MSRDVLTVGSTMRIPLLYRGEYSQWVERFMNYLEEQTDREAMIHSIKNGDQPLPRVTQVSIAGTTSTEQPPLKDKSMWSAQEKRVQKIDRLARSLLIQGLPNDIYSLIDSNKTAKDLWDALARHMLDGEAMINSIKNGDQPLPRVTQVSFTGTTSTEQPPLKDKSMWSAQEKRVQKIDRLARSLLIQGLSNDIYSLIDINKNAKDLWDALARHMLVINDLKKCGYSKDNCELNFKFLNNLQPERKQYATMMRQNKNLMDIKIDALYNILKQNQGDVNDAIEFKKKPIMVTANPLDLIAEKAKVSKSKEKVVVSSDFEGKSNAITTESNEKEDKKAKVKDYEYYKTKMLLAKKDKDEQVLLAEDQVWMESSSDSD
uniref:Integrase, catalytic region, zinc finger, CCHC-type, peptidase aspartic, catalytic n=1 Tax=Tanacetum cinerariifolium TaxID=118510 RepID=A0A699KAP0_TANCI|nr:integrase, catalytic region, zinc finger, CCHC-type, peptidase aspartic, catalytic [Tanacetum cinerariifolium]